MSEEEKKPTVTQDDEPNWKNINELFNNIDDIFTKFGTEREMTYIEMDTVLYMLKEKIFQQKVVSIAQMLSEGQPNVEFQSQADNMYK